MFLTTDMAAFCEKPPTARSLSKLSETTGLGAPKIPLSFSTTRVDCVSTESELVINPRRSARVLSIMDSLHDSAIHLMWQNHRLQTSD